MVSSRTYLDRFLFEEYKCSSRSLGVYRILYATCMLVAYLPQHLWIATLPDSFFDPPIGLTIVFTAFPPAGFFVVLNGLLVLTACALLVGYRTQLASASFALLLLIGNAWAYSFGKIDQDLPLIALPLILQFSGWGDSLSVDERRGKTPVDPSSNSWPLALLAILMGFAMLSAAVPKITGGWLDPRSHAVLGHIFRIALVERQPNWITTQVLRITSDSFWELCDYSTIMLEASFLFAAFRRPAFRVVCAVACFFHLGIAGIMEITVWSNVLAYGAFCDWSRGSNSWSQRALGIWMSLLNGWSVRRWLASSALLFLLFMTVGNPIQSLAKVLMVRAEPIALWGAIILVAAIVSSVFLVGQIRAALFSSTPPSARESRIDVPEGV